MRMELDRAAGSAIGKAARRLLPFLCLCYAVNFLDRVNVGFAALSMNQDLGFSPSVFGTGAGIFFAGYLLFEVPSNLALQRFGARIWIAHHGEVGDCRHFDGLGRRRNELLHHALPARRRRSRLLPRHHPLPHLLVPRRVGGAHRRPVRGGSAARQHGGRADLRRHARDATGERVWHVALPFTLASAAFAWAAAGGGLAVMLIALSLATLGIFAAMGPF